MAIFRLHLRRVIFFTLLGLVVAIIVGLASHPVYEGRMELQVVSGPSLHPTIANLDSHVQELVDAGAARDTLTELDVIRGEGVFDEAYDRVCQDNGKTPNKDERDKLYLMYEVSSTKDASLAIVKARAYDKKFAADVANKIGEVYNDLRKRAAVQSIQTALDYLHNQVADAEKELRRTTRDVEDYKVSHKVLDPGTQILRDTEKRTSLDLERETARAELAAASAEVLADESRLASLNRTYTASAVTIKNPVVQQLESSRADLITKKAQLTATYYEDSVQVKEVNDAIRDIDARLREIQNPTIKQQTVSTDSPEYQAVQSNLVTARIRKVNAEEKVASLTQGVDSATAAMQQLPTDEAHLNILQSSREVADNKYRRVKQEEDDLKFQTEAAARAAQILYPAVEDDQPVAPIWGKLALIGILGGICVGLIYSYTIEGLKLRVYTSSQLTELTGLPVLASVPTLPKAQARKLQRSLPTSKPALLESFRFMAFALTGSGEGPKSVLFTGVGGSVGCTTSAAQYAIAAARTGAKVALIDYDFQDGSITSLFGMEGRSGVRDLLSRTILPGEGANILYETSQPNLKVVPIGSISGINVADVPLQHLGALVEMLRKEVDLVVIDSPPVDKLSDASRMASFVDEVCLVVSAASTSYRHIPIAQEILRRSGAKEIGLVLTGANHLEEPFSSDNPFLAERGVG